MIFKLAWRSLWRNRRRTLISLSSLVFGLTLNIFFISMQDGVYDRAIEHVVNMQAGHITLEHPKYADAPSVDLYLTDAGALAQTARELPHVAQVKKIVMGQGMVKSAAANVGGAFMGIVPSREKKTSPIAKSMVEGEYLKDDDTDVVLLGRAMADHLEVSTGKKVVLAANDAHGNLVEDLARVKGIFETGSVEFDGFFVQMPLQSARKLFGMPDDSVTELGIVLDDPRVQDRTVKTLKKELKGKKLAVLKWQEVMKDLATWMRIDKLGNYLFQVILAALVLFTIFNTMLMSVLEREGEFARQIAVGATPGQIKLQVFFETLFIAAIGCLGGLILGGILSWLLHVYGFDMSPFVSEKFTVSGFTISLVIYGKIAGYVFLAPTVSVFVVTLLLSIFPMRRINRIDMVSRLR